MGRIKIHNFSTASPAADPAAVNPAVVNPHAESGGADPFDRILEKQQEVIFTGAGYETGAGADKKAFCSLVRREAQLHPEKVAKMLFYLASYAVTAYLPSEGIVRVQFTYRDNTTMDPAAFSRESCSFCENVAQIPEVIREKMIRRNQYIIVLAACEDSSYDGGNMIDKALAIRKEDSFNDAMYLDRHISRFDTGFHMNFMGLYGVFYEVQYRTTWAQEQALYSAVDRAISEMGLDRPGTAGYDKIVCAYRYIMKNAVYDYSYERYTAYDAMIGGCAVCQGYATLFYLFMRKLGVPVEYIGGISAKTGGRHGWNIVKLGHYWYNIDTTWENVARGRKIALTERKFFLKNMDDFKDHIRDEKYMTPEFQAAHPMGKKSI